MTKTTKLNLSARVLKLEIAMFLKTCEAVNTPRSLACFMLAKHGEWAQYLDLTSCDPLSSTFADDYLCTEAMRKNPRIKHADLDPEATALAGWYASEDRCRTYNRLLESEEFHVGNSDLQQVLHSASFVISKILGPLSRVDLDYVVSQFRFGPGATSHVSGRDVLLSRKMMPYSNEYGITPSLLPYFESIRGPLWSAYSTHGVASVTDSNKVVFVPKTAKTHRAIAIEPHMNIVVQLGIGALLRRKLLRYGIDLDKQADVNRQLVAKAHKMRLATIDLSSASDSIYRSLVWQLLPYDWACLLDIARVQYSLVGDRKVALEKFSSMGNGYTFELETLIFYALACACCDSVDTVAVFGDDIIVPQSKAERLVRSFEALGFQVNAKKTFLAGCFFESCGSDYWNGTNVRPFYFRGEFHDFTTAVIRTCNKIRLYAYRRNNNLGCDVRFLRAWLHGVSSCNTARRTGISQGYGDDGLIRNFDEAVPSIKRAPHGHEGLSSLVYRGVPASSRRTCQIGAYLGFLMTKERIPYADLECSREYIRGSVGLPQLRRTVIPVWRDLGPWI